MSARTRTAISASGQQLTPSRSAAGYEIVAELYDAGVCGADPIDARPGLVAMLERIVGNSVRTIIVEMANRFARDLLVQKVR
jgi:hypothetical protein